MTPPAHTIRVRTAGDTAVAVLTSGRPLTIAAVFERSFYCRDEEDRWICFLRDDLESGPLHALAAGWPDRLGDFIKEGQTLAAFGSDSLKSPTFIVELDGMRLWRQPSFPPLDAALLRNALLHLRPAVESRAPGNTLASLVFARVPADVPGDDWHRTVLKELTSGLTVLKRWLMTCRDDCLQDAVTQLVGLGHGLTPTGDDILAGTLLTLHAMRHEQRAAALAAAVAMLGATGTNRISLAHLRAAAAGQGAAPFGDILGALMRGEDEFTTYLDRIGAVGHSSGWDILTGIMTTLECCMPVQ